MTCENDKNADTTQAMLQRIRWDTRLGGNFYDIEWNKKNYLSAKSLVMAKIPWKYKPVRIQDIQGRCAEGDNKED